MRSSSGGRAGWWRLGRGVSLKMAWNTTAGVPPSKARAPVASSKSTAPKEKRSLRASSASPRACSGDM